MKPGLTKVTLLSKSDIHKYWIMKQITTEHNITDIFINKIHPLLMSFKFSISKTPLELTKMKTFGYRDKTCFRYCDEMPDQFTLALIVKNYRSAKIKKYIECTEDTESVYRIKPKFVSREPERTNKLETVYI